MSEITPTKLARVNDIKAEIDDYSWKIIPPMAPTAVNNVARFGKIVPSVVLPEETYHDVKLKMRPLVVLQKMVEVSDIVIINKLLIPEKKKSKKKKRAKRPPKVVENQRLPQQQREFFENIIISSQIDQDFNNAWNDEANIPFCENPLFQSPPKEIPTDPVNDVLQAYKEFVLNKNDVIPEPPNKKKRRNTESIGYYNELIPSSSEIDSEEVTCESNVEVQNVEVKNEKLKRQKPKKRRPVFSKRKKRNVRKVTPIIEDGINDFLQINGPEIMNEHLDVSTPVEVPVMKFKDLEKTTNNPEFENPINSLNIKRKSAPVRRVLSSPKTSKSIAYNFENFKITSTVINPSKGNNTDDSTEIVTDDANEDKSPNVVQKVVKSSPNVPKKLKFDNFQITTQLITPDPENPMEPQPINSKFVRKRKPAVKKRKHKSKKKSIIRKTTKASIKDPKAVIESSEKFESKIMCTISTKSPVRQVVNRSPNKPETSPSEISNLVITRQVVNRSPNKPETSPSEISNLVITIPEINKKSRKKLEMVPSATSSKSPPFVKQVIQQSPKKSETCPSDMSNITITFHASTPELPKPRKIVLKSNYRKKNRRKNIFTNIFSHHCQRITSLDYFFNQRPILTQDEVDHCLAPIEYPQSDLEDGEIFEEEENIEPAIEKNELNELKNREHYPTQTHQAYQTTVTNHQAQVVHPAPSHYADHPAPSHYADHPAPSHYADPPAPSHYEDQTSPAPTVEPLRITDLREKISAKSEFKTPFQVKRPPWKKETVKLPPTLIPKKVEPMDKSHLNSFGVAETLLIKEKCKPSPFDPVDDDTMSLFAESIAPLSPVHTNEDFEEEPTKSGSYSSYNQVRVTPETRPQPEVYSNLNFKPQKYPQAEQKSKTESTSLHSATQNFTTSNFPPTSSKISPQSSQQRKYHSNIPPSRNFNPTSKILSQPFPPEPLNQTFNPTSKILSQKFSPEASSNETFKPKSQSPVKTLPQSALPSFQWNVLPENDQVSGTEESLSSVRESTGENSLQSHPSEDNSEWNNFSNPNEKLTHEFNVEWGDPMRRIDYQEQFKRSRINSLEIDRPTARHLVDDLYKDAATEDPLRQSLQRYNICYRYLEYGFCGISDGLKHTLPTDLEDRIKVLTPTQLEYSYKNFVSTYTFLLEKSMTIFAKYFGIHENEFQLLSMVQQVKNINTASTLPQKQQEIIYPIFLSIINGLCCFMPFNEAIRNVFDTIEPTDFGSIDIILKVILNEPEIENKWDLIYKIVCVPSYEIPLKSVEKILKDCCMGSKRQYYLRRIYLDVLKPLADVNFRKLDKQIINNFFKIMEAQDMKETIQLKERMDTVSSLPCFNPAIPPPCVPIVTNTTPTCIVEPISPQFNVRLPNEPSLPPTKPPLLPIPITRDNRPQILDEQIIRSGNIPSSSNPQDQFRPNVVMNTDFRIQNGSGPMQSTSFRPNAMEDNNFRRQNGYPGHASSNHQPVPLFKSNALEERRRNGRFNNNKRDGRRFLNHAQGNMRSDARFLKKVEDPGGVPAIQQIINLINRNNMQVAVSMLTQFQDHPQFGKIVNEVLHGVPGHSANYVIQCLDSLNSRP